MVSVTVGVAVIVWIFRLHIADYTTATICVEAVLLVVNKHTTTIYHSIISHKLLSTSIANRNIAQYDTKDNRNCESITIGQ